MKAAWIQNLGSFDIKENDIIFDGKPTKFKNREGKDDVGSAVGMAITNEYFNEGKISVEVKFTSIDTQSTAQIMFYNDPSSGSNISAGIISEPGMFGIQNYFDSKIGYYSTGGQHQNLKPNKFYKIIINVKGSQVDLSIDGVISNSYIIPGILKRTQPGILAVSKSKTIFKNFKIEAKKPVAFVIMEFSEKYKEVYEEVIKEVCSENFDLQVIKADEIYGPGMIISDINVMITNAKVIIADITPLNANIFYEVGYAHALKKPTILIAEKQTKLPFDLSSFRTLFYENTIAGKDKVKEGLRKHLDSILNFA